MSACDSCGACCKTFPIFVSESDAVREPRVGACSKKLEPWQQTPEWHFQLYPLPFLSACPFLDDCNLCRIYETRPAVCRRFEAGSPQCAEARERQGLGPLVVASELIAIGEGRSQVARG